MGHLSPFPPSLAASAQQPAGKRPWLAAFTPLLQQPIRCQAGGQQVQESPHSPIPDACGLWFVENWSVEAISCSFIHTRYASSQFTPLGKLWCLLVWMLGSLLASCAALGSGETDKPLLMVDCQFQANKHIHKHVDEEVGTVALITRYSPTETSDHSEDLRKGIESKGRLIKAVGYRLVVEMYLLNDRLGESPGEDVRILVADDGRSRIEARAPHGALRTIDTGVCILPEVKG
jgi:hypothetical protein